MNWEMISVTIPEDIQTLVKGIQTIDEEAMVAGGFMTDLYLDKPFHDVDIFIKESNQSAVWRWIRDQGIPCRAKGEYEGIKVFSLEGMVIEFSYEGYKIQVIPTSYGKDILSFFDLTIREMYYDGTTSYASAAALDSIQRKTIEIGSLTHALRTLHRVKKCSYKYGYTVEEDTMDWLKQCIHDQPIKVLSQFVENNVEPHLQEELLAMIHQHEVKGRFHYDKGKENTVAALLEGRKPQPSEIWQKVMKKPVNIHQVVTFPFSMEELLTQYREIKETVKTMVKRSTTILMFDAPDVAEEWRNHIDNDDYFYNVFLHYFVNNVWKGEMKEAVREIHEQVQHLDNVKKKLRLTESNREDTVLLISDSSIPLYILQKEGWDAYVEGKLLFACPMYGHGSSCYRTDTSTWSHHSLNTYEQQQMETYVLEKMAGVVQ